MTVHIAAEPPTYDQVRSENGSIVVAAKAYADARFLEGTGREPEIHEMIVAKAGALANLLADRLATPEDGMHTVHAGNYFAFLMEDQ